MRVFINPLKLPKALLMDIKLHFKVKEFIPISAEVSLILCSKTVQFFQNFYFSKRIDAIIQNWSFCRSFLESSMRNLHA